jgi:flagellar M-ring protein FliF
VWDIAKQVLGGLLVLFLIFGVIRPAFKDLNKVPVDGNNPQAGGGVDGMSAEQALTGGGDAADEIAKITTGTEEMEGTIENVRSLVQQDPALVAQVVKNWAASE